MAATSIRRTCAACKTARPLSDYGRSSGYRDGFRKQCRVCRSDYERKRRQRLGLTGAPVDPEKAHARHIKLKYGLSREQYQAILAAQDGVCGICRKTPPMRHFRNLFVDHCHKTGRVRGLLCNHCNLALGRLGDDISGLKAAIAYLEKGGGSHG